MTRRHYDELAELAAATFGGEMSDELRREVLWRGWVSRAPGGWTLTALGRRELTLEARRRADERDLARCVPQASSSAIGGTPPAGPPASGARRPAG